jgi:hypothetical protein
MPHYRRALPCAKADGIARGRVRRFRWARDETAALPFSEGGCSQPTGEIMDQRIVSTPENARSASKQGVVRYVLALSLLLVVILFAVAYRVSV